MSETCLEDTESTLAEWVSSKMHLDDDVDFPYHREV